MDVFIVLGVFSAAAFVVGLVGDDLGLEGLAVFAAVDVARLPAVGCVATGCVAPCLEDLTAVGVAPLLVFAAADRATVATFSTNAFALFALVIAGLPVFATFSGPTTFAVTGLTANVFATAGLTAFALGRFVAAGVATVATCSFFFFAAVTGLAVFVAVRRFAEVGAATGLATGVTEASGDSLDSWLLF